MRLILLTLLFTAPLSAQVNPAAGSTSPAGGFYMPAMPAPITPPGAPAQPAADTVTPPAIAPASLLAPQPVKPGPSQPIRYEEGNEGEGDQRAGHA